MLIDEVRAGGRIPLIIGRGLTNKARESLGLEATEVFRHAKSVAQSNRGFSLAQKWLVVLAVAQVFALVNTVSQNDFCRFTRYNWPNDP